MGKLTVRTEKKKLDEIYQNLPENKKKLAEGLIEEAARLRVRLKYLWEDLQENGETELFSQSPNTPPYQRERPQARLFTSTDKNYQSIIKTLNDMLPPEAPRSKLDLFLNDDE